MIDSLKELDGTSNKAKRVELLTVVDEMNASLDLLIIFLRQLNLKITRLNARQKIEE